MDAYDDAGNLMSKEVMRQAFEDAGYDALVDPNPYSKWGQGSGRTNYMQGITPDTEHMIFFKPNQLRSKFAKFDPKNIDSSDLLATVAPAAIGLGLLGNFYNENRNPNEI